MRDLAGVLVAAIVCFSIGAEAQEMNYDIFPGEGTQKGNGPYTYEAEVFSFQDSVIYQCIADYATKRNPPLTLKCTKASFSGSLMSGSTVKTVQIRGNNVNNPDVPFYDAFWQLDQGTGSVQFCIVSGSCVGTTLGGT